MTSATTSSSPTRGQSVVELPGSTAVGVLIDEPKCRLLGIGEAAARTGVSERALRYYRSWS